jgi:tetrahydromethanopterin S-methyltransferase subunit A
MSTQQVGVPIDRDSAIQRVHRELDQVRQVKKCTSCECFLDVLDGVQSDIADVDTPAGEAARTDMRRWWEAGNPKRHRCPGCEVCLPIAPYNQFSATLGGTEPTPPQAPAAACGCSSGGAACHGSSPEPESEPAVGWPLLPGDYLVGDPAAAVALCTLADTDLPSELRAAGLLDRVAIVGTLTTENLGIERLILNVAANPHIRYLVLCGRDSRGHRAGQSLLAFKTNGVDEHRRILGALGPRPVLKNVSDDELKVFRARVSLLDEIDTTDVSRLVEVAHACRTQQGALSIELPPRIRRPKLIEAEPPAKREWVHDPEGFFLVLLDREHGAILCEHYTQDGTLSESIRGTRASDIASTAIKRGLLSRLDHAAYLGRELAKAEVALTFELPYTQDAALTRAERAGARAP